MQLSVIVATRDRGDRLTACLDAIAASLARAALPDGEVVVVDNGSTDATAGIVDAWAARSGLRVTALREPSAGKARALNRALRSAAGELLFFTDDDCRLHPQHIADLLRHHAADTGPVVRGGRIELGDPADLPLTISTTLKAMRWSRACNSMRHDSLAGVVNGCNMAVQRGLADRIGFFDERLGPGSPIGSGEDTDYLFRAYLSGATIEYVPDMLVFHHHGRRTDATGQKVMRDYMIGSGALCMKYLFRHPTFCLPFYWDVRNALQEIVTGTNTFKPEIGFRHRDKVACSLRGSLRYLFTRGGPLGA